MLYSPSPNTGRASHISLPSTTKFLTISEDPQIFKVKLSLTLHVL